MLGALVVVGVAAVVLWFVLAPMRPGFRLRAESEHAAERDDLEARKEAKYREIRDAELDHRMGKTSKADWRVIDRGLRAEAIEVLKALDELDGRAESSVERAPSARIGA